MKELEKFTDEEIFAEFHRRFADISLAAEMMGYEHNGAVGQLVSRKKLKRWSMGPRYNVYAKADLIERAKTRPGKGGRPPNSAKKPD